MANDRAEPGKANGSQFYVALSPLPDRDGVNVDGSLKSCQDADSSCHTVFGKVIKGMRFLDADAVDAHAIAVNKATPSKKSKS